MLPMNSIEKKMYCELVLSVFDRPGTLNRSNWGEVEETYPNLFQCEHKSQILRVRVKFNDSSPLTISFSPFELRRVKDLYFPVGDYTIEYFHKWVRTRLDNPTHILHKYNTFHMNELKRRIAREAQP